ncbi:MAG TPA: cytochrome c-type biogenesis protein CcmH [Solirubrobacterales bacterium]|nr:cytochrome c-type biogenesis protein CcmH [Solirubrobacterales bacterium]
MRRLALLAAVVLSLAAPAAAMGAAPVPKTTVSDVEDEVMCPICGTLLELSDSPQARRQKVYVAKLVAEGRTKAEIKDALVSQYGPAALALPEATGFDLSAYLVPVVALVVAVCALALGVARWRRDGDRSPPPGAATAPQGEEAERLEADLRRYDL